MSEPDLVHLSARITETDRRRGLFFVACASALVGGAITLQTGLNSNFLVGEIGISGFQAGLLEAVRESCGIAALGIFVLVAGLAEPVIASLFLVLVAVGIGSYSVAPTYRYVMLLSVTWSLGFHVWTPLPNSMTLALAEPGRAGARLGRIGAAGALGSAAGLLIAFLLTLIGVKIRYLYLLIGAAALVAAAACMGIPRDLKAPGPSFVFRKRYQRYYLLNFLEGWRKQIAIAFGGFLLVKVHGAGLMEILVLAGIIQAIGYFTSSRVGRLIDRVGERKVLVFYYSFVTLMFLGYAFLRGKYILYTVYILDNATFVFNTGLTTYVNKIAPKSEHRPTLSMGVAANHIASVTMPLVGGILWATLGYQWAFLIGVPAAAASIVTVLGMPDAHRDARNSSHR
ncbi:MAG: MFS transporter [Spirochaetia bacterium]|jgi:predicted MFS family arabinose efflux permease